MTVSHRIDPLTQALWGTLETPNRMDANGENANVVDGLFAISDAIRVLARIIAANGNIDGEAFDLISRGNFLIERDVSEDV